MGGCKKFNIFYRFMLKTDFKAGKTYIENISRADVQWLVVIAKAHPYRGCFGGW